MQFSLFGFLSIAIIVFGLSGCETPQRTVRVTQSNTNVLEEAHMFFQQGKYEAALMKYSSYVYSPFPDKKDIDEARYHIGLCHYLLQQYPEAAESMTVLLNNHPGFSMTAEAQEILTKSRTQIQEQLITKTNSQNQTGTEISQLEEQLNQSPRNAQLHYQLGNRYWEAGEFQTAALHYEHAIQLNSDYEQDATIRRRAFYNETNILTPRDPVKEFQAQDKVIRLNNVNHNVRTREDWLGRRESIRVSGEAENVTLRPVNNVEVEVTLVDFFGTIQDSRMVRIGRIHAGETRTFSVLLDQFSGSANDNLQVKTQVYFEE